MAGNIKGQGKFMSLLLLHGEKIGIALVAVAALWLIYKTTSLPHLEDKFQANKLRDETTQTSTAVQNASWPDAGSEQAAEVRTFKPMDKKADAAVPVDPYKTVQDFDGVVIAPTMRRSDPVLLNAVDVRAVGCSGLFAFIDEAVRKQRALEKAEEAANEAKREADRQEKEAKAAGEGKGGGREAGRRGRESGGIGDGSQLPFDKDHPKRKPLMGSAVALGVPRQGDERVEQAYWAVVTAKVPIRNQLKMFQDAFEKAKLGYDPMRDFPHYKGYLVQRAEVVGGKDAKDLDWKAVPVYDGQQKSIKSHTPLSANGFGGKVMEALALKMQTDWAGMSADVIDPRFADYLLTFPLPPLVGREWGPEAKHPDFPMIADTPPLEEEAPPEPTTNPMNPANPGQPAAPTDPNAAFATGTLGAGGPISGGAGGMLGGGGYRGRAGGEGGLGGVRPGGGMAGMIGGRGMMEGGEGGPRRGGGGGGYGSMPTGESGRTSLPKGVDFLMLRFLDFTVEPGKKYKYRVSLVLGDPNFTVPENVLAADAADRRAKESQAARARKTNRSDLRFVEGWSDPSPTVGIPLAGNVKLVDVKAASSDKINDEPTTTLLVESVDYDEKNNAIQAAVKKKDIRRGSVVNMVEDAEYLGEGWTDVWKNFKFNTGMTVLDMDGGKAIAKDYKSPGRVLLMGPAGELYIHSEDEDKPTVDYHDSIFDEDKRKAMFGEGGFEGGRGGPRPGGMRGGNRGER